MISLDLLRIALKEPDHAEDDYILELESAAVAYIENQTGRYYGPERTRTEVVVGGGRSTLYLEGPILLDAYDAPHVVSVYEATYAGAEQTEIVEGDDDGFVVREAVLHRKDGRAWLRGYEYEVEYLQGYAAGDEPGDIRKAVVDLVMLWFNIRLPVALGTVAPEVPHNVSAIIQAHRRMVV